jgi:hypothetical protein
MHSVNNPVITLLGTVNCDLTERVSIVNDDGPTGNINDDFSVIVEHPFVVLVTV